ncbi:MAG TPA: hypothetical protein VFI78_00330 [Salinimicrobium sp.]|nr:hypothetical protein [Salinimicrobium sp.]
MKKLLKEELISLAKQIVALESREQAETGEISRLKDRAQELYEKLTIFDFTERNLSRSVPVESRSNKEPARKDFSENQEKDYAPDGTEYNDSDAITEPNTEKIKDIVSQMPPGDQRVDSIMENLNRSRYRGSKNDMEDIGGVHYDHLPQFEPATPKAHESDRPRSLNDRLKNNIQIGVNERHAFVKHLFEGSNTDYNRVISQLNTIKSKEEAMDFILNMVKPDYNNWEGKEELEIRFLAKVENKFE